MQLAVLLDGSGTIDEQEWNVEINGLYNAIVDPNCVPDHCVELTVIQFAGDLPGGARTEVPPTVVTNSNRYSVGAEVLNIIQVEGITPIEAGIDLAVEELMGSPYFSTTPRQIINISGDVGHIMVDYDATEIARDNAIAAIEHGIHRLEISAEGVGDIIPEDINWLRDEIVWPQPGTIAPPFTPGWVYKVGLNTAKVKEAICEKIEYKVTAEPTPTPTPRPTPTPTPIVSTSVAIECPSAPQGGTDDVDITIDTDDPQGIGSATITLTVDTSVVEVVNVADGDLGTVYWNTAGSTTTMSAAVGYSPGPKGTLTFATVTLLNKGGAGECRDLDIEVLTLFDGTLGFPQPIAPSPVTDCICAPDRLEGDVHPLGAGNGVIDSADSQLIAQHIMGAITLSGDDLLAADVNDYGSVDSADLQLLAQYLVGTITAFPGGEYIP